MGQMAEKAGEAGGSAWLLCGLHIVTAVGKHRATGERLPGPVFEEQLEILRRDGQHGLNVDTRSSCPAVEVEIAQPVVRPWIERRGAERIIAIAQVGQQVQPAAR